jgi:CheY-like chemotaxis protein
MALIMVAEDHPDMLRVLQGLLERRGHQVVPVSNGVELVEEAMDWHPELIITDIVMPSLYGSTASKTLMENPDTSKIPTVFITAVDRDTAEKLVPESPNVRLLNKPVSIEQLDQCVDELLKPPG